jgi:hypothetical protein
MSFRAAPYLNKSQQPPDTNGALKREASQSLQQQQPEQPSVRDAHTSPPMLTLWGPKLRSDGTVAGGISNRLDFTARQIKIACYFTWESGSDAKEFIIDQVVPPRGYVQFVSAPLGIRPPEPAEISCDIAGYD